MWSSSAAAIAQSVARYPLPAGTTFGYGTAGFRTTGALLPAVGFRMAFVCALRSLLSNGKSVGMMITASHNPAVDNGVKLVDVDGCMLTRSWEAFATRVANAIDGEAILAVVHSFVESLGATAAPTAPLAPRIHVARDTRPTGAAILEALQLAVAALNTDIDGDVRGKVTVVDHGLLATPQLHTMVYLENIESVADVHPGHYYARVGGAFEALHRRYAANVTPSASEGKSRQRVVVDCANGIGALSLRALLEHMPSLSEWLDVVLVNDRTEDIASLNDGCGADYVQKVREAPPMFAEWFKKDPSALFFSCDGDADRVVAFHFDEHGAATLLDGDRLAILFAKFIGLLLQGAGDEAKRLDVGIVQTAYANGASTSYVNALGLRTYCAATGVKFLHPIAEERDVGVYFEANGHGTVLFREARLAAALASFPDTYAQFQQLSHLLSQACGDAVADLLCVVLALQRLRWTSSEWVAMYTDLPSVQLKVHVPHPKRIACTSDERRAVAPDGLQGDIDAALAASNDPTARGFVRPSGTEPLVRVYVEASAPSTVASLGDTLSNLVKKYCS